MRPLTMRLLVSAFLVALAVPAFAVTYLVPPDGEIVRAAKAIVIATGMGSYSVQGDDGRMTYTIYKLRVDDVLKGELHVAETIEIREPGGCLGTRCISFPGMPEYRPGERAVVFLESDRGRWSTWSGALGKFNFVHDARGRKLLVRGGTEGEIFGWDSVGNAHVEPFRDEERFLAYVRAEAGGTRAVANYIGARADVTFARTIRPDSNSKGFSASNYVVQLARWKCIFDQPPASMAGCGGNSSVSFTLFGTASGVNGPAAANAGMAAWNGDALSNVNYVAGNSVAAAPWNRGDALSSIHFDDDADTAVCGAQAIGCGGATFDSTNPHMFDGTSFAEIVAGDVAVKTGFTSSQAYYGQVVCHELGHTLGFRHSDQGTPSTSSAIMVSSSNSGSPLGAVLQTWDRDAVSTVYNPSPAGTCTPASISNQPQDKSIVSGQPANVAVTAAGDTPLTYQWFFGASNTDTSNPVAGQTTATLTHAPTSTTSYWVRVNGCNSSSVASRVVTVTVTACTPPSINSQPQGTTIASGNSATLTVGAAGSAPFTYQWYVGTPQDTSSPIGTNTSSILVFPTATTTYWVRVTGQCAPVANSTAATVTVTGSTCPDITIAPPTANQQSNGTYNLTVNASSQGRPLTYQWFQGSVPGSGTLLNTGQTVNVPAPTGPVSYWVKVFNDCGKQANSATVVTISPCELANITTEPADQSIGNGASATLTIAFTSPTNTTVTWYRGVAPDKTNQAGTGASLNTGPLTTTTQYWATVTNTCGEKLTRTATITVDSCTAPQIQSVSPASASTDIGKTVTLIAAATGTATLHYQWYEGASGDTSKPVGTDSATFTSAALTVNTKFWVKVSNGCGNVNSSTVNVTVVYPRRHSARS
jgi:hypothetical protein